MSDFKISYRSISAEMRFPIRMSAHGYQEQYPCDFVTPQGFHKDSKLLVDLGL